MKRILLFLSVLLGTALLVFLLVVGTNWNAYVILFENKKGLREGSEWIEKTYSLKGLTQYIGQNGKNVSVVSYPINKPDSGIYYNANTPRVMGAQSNIFLIIEYAKRVTEGNLNPNERISLREIERYKLPNIDDGTHEDAINTLQTEKLLTPENTLTLQTAIKVVAEFNNLAFADYFYFRFGKQALDSLMYNEFAMNSTEPYLPFSGLYQIISPVLQEESPRELYNRLSQMNRANFSNKVITLAEKYYSTPDYRDRVKNKFEKNGLNVLFTEKRDLLSLFPKTTARDMTQLLRNVQKGNYGKQEAAEKALEILSWPMKQSQMQHSFDQYSAMYDNRMGILNGIDTGISAYTENLYVQAIYFDKLPVAFWIHMSSNHMHQDYQQRLIWDPALRKATKQAIKSKEANKALIMFD